MQAHEATLVVDPQAQTDETQTLNAHVQRQRTEPGYYAEPSLATKSAASSMGFFDGSTRTGPAMHSTMPPWNVPSYPGTPVPPTPPITLTPYTGGTLSTGTIIKATMPDGYVTAGVHEAVTILGIAPKMWIKLVTKGDVMTRFLLVGNIETELTPELAEAIMRGAGA